MYAKIIVSLKTPYVEPVSGDLIQIVGGKAQVDIGSGSVKFATSFGDVVIPNHNIALSLTIHNETVDTDTMPSVQFINEING